MKIFFYSFVLRAPDGTFLADGEGFKEMAPFSSGFDALQAKEGLRQELLRGAYEKARLPADTRLVFLSFNPVN